MNDRAAEIVRQNFFWMFGEHKINSITRDSKGVLQIEFQECLRPECIHRDCKAHQRREAKKG